MDNHDIYMRRCLQLAQLGAGKVAPNPIVGAVLINNDRIIGEGYHEQYGHAHAEVNCINNVPEEMKQLIKESTLYVSLEPCTHYGKTPPCADLIIKNQIPRVVIGCEDSFEKVNGSGIQKLKDAGINVITGVLEKEAIELNKRFFTFHKKKRPYIILKWAQSSDLKIANNDRSRVMISNDISNRLVHKWRAEEAAIMVGTHTALGDNPSLTTRLWPGKNPVRILLDKFLELPSTLKLFDQSVQTIIINTVKQEEQGNNIFYKVAENENVLVAVMNILYQKNLTSLIVEGGAVLLQSFIDEGCWDEARLITNNELIIRNGVTAPVLKNEWLYGTEKLLSDTISFYINTGLAY